VKVARGRAIGIAQDRRLVQGAKPLTMALSDMIVVANKKDGRRHAVTANLLIMLEAIG
jgi:hypothetical protein